MSMRSVSLYVEPKTIRRLRLLITLYPRYKVDDVTGIKTAITTDQLADDLLREAIDSQFPLVRKLEKELAKTEQDFIKNNKGTNNNENYKNNTVTNT